MTWVGKWVAASPACLHCEAWGRPQAALSNEDRTKLLSSWGCEERELGDLERDTGLLSLAPSQLPTVPVLAWDSQVVANPIVQRAGRSSLGSTRL